MTVAERAPVHAHVGGHLRSSAGPTLPLAQQLLERGRRVLLHRLLRDGRHLQLREGDVPGGREGHGLLQAVPLPLVMRVHGVVHDMLQETGLLLRYHARRGRW